MAIQIDSFQLPMSVDEARRALQRHTDNFGIFFDVDRCFEIAGILQLRMRKARRELRDIMHANVNIDDKTEVIKQLINMGVSPNEFGDKADTLTAAVRQAITDNVSYGEDVHQAVKVLEQYGSDKRNKGNIVNYALLPHSVSLSKYVHRMSVGHPTWSILSTSRLAASNPGIQGIPRDMGDIITEPKGYTLVRCDSGQIEPRINFSTYLKDELIMKLIMHYNDAYFGILHYCMMKQNEEDACRDNFELNFHPMEITEEIKNMRQLIKRMTNAGSYGSGNLTAIHPVLGKLYEAKIVKHPARLALERKVTQEVQMGTNTFYSMFGTPVRPSSTEKYTEGEGSWQQHLIRCGINNPVQTTASDLMLFSINEALNIIHEAKDTHICYYKHDEACFYVSDDDMANGVGDKLSDVTAYNVKGWIPIEADAMIGPKKPTLPSYIA